MCASDTDSRLHVREKLARCEFSSSAELVQIAEWLQVGAFATGRLTKRSAAHLAAWNQDNRTHAERETSGSLTNNTVCTSKYSVHCKLQYTTVLIMRMASYNAAREVSDSRLEEKIFLEDSRLEEKPRGAASRVRTRRCAALPTCEEITRRDATRRYPTHRVQ